MVFTVPSSKRELSLNDQSHNPLRLPPFDPSSGLLNAYVECAAGSGTKDKFDPALAGLRFHKAMPAEMTWPFAYGFVCGTCAPDGDPVDVVMLSDAHINAGTLVPARILGGVVAEQTIGSDTFRNDRIIASDARPGTTWRAAAHAFTAEEVRVIERFFIEYNAAQGRRFRIIRHLSADEARALVESSAK